MDTMGMRETLGAIASASEELGDLRQQLSSLQAAHEALAARVASWAEEGEQPLQAQELQKQMLGSKATAEEAIGLVRALEERIERTIAAQVVHKPSEEELSRKVQQSEEECTNLQSRLTQRIGTVDSILMSVEKDQHSDRWAGAGHGAAAP